MDVFLSENSPEQPFIWFYKMSISQTLQNSLSSRKNVWICSRSNLAMIKKSKFSSLILPGTKNQDCGHLSSILHMKALQRKLKKLNQDFWVGSLGIFVSFHDLLKIVMLFPRKLINKIFYDYLLWKLYFKNSHSSSSDSSKNQCSGIPESPENQREYFIFKCQIAFWNLPHRNHFQFLLFF